MDKQRPPHRVYLFLRPAMSAASRGKWVAEWVSRVTSDAIYTSKPQPTREEAEAKAREWFARNKAPLSFFARGLVDDTTEVSRG